MMFPLLVTRLLVLAGQPATPIQVPCEIGDLIKLIYDKNLAEEAARLHLLLSVYVALWLHRHDSKSNTRDAEAAAALYKAWKKPGASEKVEKVILKEWSDDAAWPDDVKYLKKEVPTFDDGMRLLEVHRTDQQIYDAVMK